MNAPEINVLKELIGRSLVDKVAPAMLITGRGKQQQIIMMLLKHGLVQFITKDSESREVFAVAVCNVDKFIKAGWKKI